ncbi:MAG: ATP-binding protein [Rhodospirillales bacterium]|nr:ATP-binding protein [Rhodospirillales bacterium]
MALSTMLKPYLPKSLLGRSVLIIVMPLILLQVISATVFFENHWNKVGRRLALDVAGEIALLIDVARDTADGAELDTLFKRAALMLQLEVSYEPGAVLSNTDKFGESILVGQLTAAMNEVVNRPHRIDADTQDRFVEIDVQLAEGVLNVVVPNKRLFSTTTYVFVLWMAGTSMLLFGVAVIFMRNQVRPIRRLAQAANDFGMGRDSPKFKPEGASEVRRAAVAFIAMRNRIKRHIQQRTDMLAGVSHDLRTPLTRMKLQLAMMGETSGVDELNSDVLDMEHMLEEYLAFARGEGGEKVVEANLSEMLGEIVAQARRKGGAIDLHTEGDIVAPVRVNALKRALTNLVDNSVRHADHISIRLRLRGEMAECVIDDDGPGIPADKREEVFKPFFRLDTSRNSQTGGVGLGMTIARDAIRGHGGDVVLDDAPGGGLRVKVILPL